MVLAHLAVLDIKLGDRLRVRTRLDAGDESFQGFSGGHLGRATAPGWVASCRRANHGDKKGSAGGTGHPSSNAGQERRVHCCGAGTLPSLESHHEGMSR
jgi:hypothetical protein